MGGCYKLVLRLCRAYLPLGVGEAPLFLFKNPGQDEIGLSSVRVHQLCHGDSEIDKQEPLSHQEVSFRRRQTELTALEPRPSFPALWSISGYLSISTSL